MDAFDEYLNSKIIDVLAFRNELPELHASWHQLFDQMHPASFTSQKLYLINGIRRQFPLRPTEKEQVAEVAKNPMKPRVKIPVKKN